MARDYNKDVKQSLTQIEESKDPILFSPDEQAIVDRYLSALNRVGRTEIDSIKMMQLIQNHKILKGLINDMGDNYVVQKSSGSMAAHPSLNFILAFQNQISKLELEMGFDKKELDIIRKISAEDTAESILADESISA